MQSQGSLTAQDKFIADTASNAEARPINMNIELVADERCLERCGAQSKTRNMSHGIENALCQWGRNEYSNFEAVTDQPDGQR